MERRALCGIGILNRLLNLDIDYVNSQDLCNSIKTAADDSYCAITRHQLLSIIKNALIGPQIAQFLLDLTTRAVTLTSEKDKQSEQEWNIRYMNSYASIMNMFFVRWVRARHVTSTASRISQLHREDYFTGRCHSCCVHMSLSKGRRFSVCQPLFQSISSFCPNRTSSH